MSEEFPQIDLSDLPPVEIPVKNVPAAPGREFVLREPSEEAVARWKNAGVKYALRNDRGDYIGASGGSELDAMLVASCLFERTPQGEKPVPVETVRGWGSRVVQRLYKAALKASGMAAEGETPQKLQGQFSALVVKLASQASTPAEKRQWADWMVGEVHEKLPVVGLNGSHEEREKNSPAATPATSG